MRKLLLLVCSVGLSFALAVARDKIASQWKCDAKPAVEHILEAGDQPGYAYSVSQGKCTSKRRQIG